MILALVVMVPVAAEATTWIVPEPAELARSADAIVLARVDSIRSVAAFDGSTIETEIVLHVVEAWKGAASGDRIVVREVGGTVGEDQQWIFGSAEYQVGEIVVAHLALGEGGVVRTLHMGLGKSTVDVAETGEVTVSRLRAGGRKERVRLQHFRGELDRAGVKPLGRRLARSRLAQASVASAPLLGRAQSNRKFQLLGNPGARWFRTPLQIWGALTGDKKLGKTASNRIIQNAAAVWDEQPGSELDLIYAGERKSTGWVCNDGFVSVAYNDPQNQIANPQGCGGGALAIGGFCMSRSPFGNSPYHEIVSGSIVVADGWGSCWFWNEKNISEIMTHELGHTFGFGHSWDGNMGQTSDRFITDATMYWTAHFDGRGAALADYDQGALAWLYADGGTPTGPSPAPSPTPAPPAPTPTPEPQPDSDGDGWEDDIDNCPMDANRRQRDRDRDGVGDVCDSCPNQSNPDQATTCGTVEGTARISQRKNGVATLSVRLKFAPRIDAADAGRIRITVEGNGRVYDLDVPAGMMHASQDGTRARYRGQQADIFVRKWNASKSLVGLRVKSRALVDLAGSDLVLKIEIGDVRTEVRMSCRTRQPEGRIITRCDS
ncbi:MAG: thrombospondin type 3 repeat-containing protein [Deltaproteobacteria bacterium]